MVQCTIENAAQVIHVGIGQAVVAGKTTHLVATLGASVGLSLYSPADQVGILAHIVLPHTNHRTAMPAKYADIAVPYMVDLLRQRGARTVGLVAKLVGGACMFGDKEVGQIGDATVATVLQSLQVAEIMLSGSDVGGTGGRRITFSAEDGSMNVQAFGVPAFTL